MSKPRLYLSSPHIGPDELGLVQDAFATNWIAPLGPHVDAFEKEFCALLGEQTQRNPVSDIRDSVKSAHPHSESRPTSHAHPAIHAAALSSGTAAIHLALRWLNLQPGDEVITSTLTFSATANPILYERATPVFVDSDLATWNMDPARLAEAIEDGLRRGRKPKAVILVHLYGQSADIDPIAGTCAHHGIPLIEDAAEALGAVYYSTKSSFSVNGDPLSTKQDSLAVPRDSAVTAIEKSNPPPDVSRITRHEIPGRRRVSPGTIGLCGIFSFNGNKIITTSGGGMLVSNDAKLIDKARFWATQARDPAPHYQHSEVGFNYRMSNVLAAIGRGQLRVLDARVNARRANCAFYQEAFKDLPGFAFMPEAAYGRCTRWLTCITIDPTVAGTDREKVRLALAEENIEARPVWKPMHLQPVFAGARCYGGAVAERLFDHGLCLPSGSNLTESDLQRVVEVVRRCFGRKA